VLTVERATPVRRAEGSIRHGKIEIPAAPALFVPRPELCAELDRQADAGDPGHVLIVSGGAGYGKTAAVADWVRASPGLPTAWVRLDDGDRDDQQFWASVLAALRACPGVPADSTVRTLTAAWPPAGPGAGTAFVTAALNAVAALPAAVRLVLDDVHVLVAHPGLQGVRDLVAHRLPTLSLVLISRLDPPVGLHRLRLDGRLGEVRARHLTFTPERTVELFAAQAPELSGEQVAVLHARTEGWVAALRLAGVSLRSWDDPARFVAEFAGDDRSVADYLIGEILGGLAERERVVLDAASVCDTVTAELAVALSGREDAGEALESLEESTALLTPTDPHRTHYRVHDLLRSHLTSRLRRRHPAALTALNLRAAQWHRDRHEHLEVVRYTALAGDPRETRTVLRAHAVELLDRGQFTVVAETVAGLAEGADDPDPRLALVAALVEIERGSVEGAARLADDAQRHADHDEDGDVELLRRVVAARRALAKGRTEAAFALARTIHPDTADGLPLQALALLTRGSLLMGTDPELARADCDRALALADGHGWSYLGMQVLTALGVLDATGPHRRTSATARAADERATSQGWQDSAWAIASRIVLAVDALMRCEPGAAHDHVEQARRGRLVGHPQLTLALDVLGGAADHDLGHRLDGWRRMRAARHRAGSVDLEDRQAAFVLALEHAAAVGLGRHREAQEVVRWAGARIGDSEDVAVAQAHGQWALRRDAAARARLAATFAGGVPLLPETVVHADLLDAEIALARRERTAARSRLDHALGLAEDLDVVRPFALAPDPIRQLLAEGAGGLGSPRRFVDRILAVAAPARPGGAPPAELTDREHAVLALLPTQRSLHEIADDLTVSPNTVKTHLRAIYAKLGATSRREAVVRARHDQLLRSSG
jgi:LuxR family transcriptional regulator, maltose regulon positive regulatory protein